MDKNSKGEPIRKETFISIIMSAVLALDIILINMLPEFLTVPITAGLVIAAVAMIVKLINSKGHTVQARILIVYITFMAFVAILILDMFSKGALKGDASLEKLVAWVFSSKSPAVTETLAPTETPTMTPTEPPTEPPTEDPTSAFRNGHCIYFGSYPQKTSYADPILWTILSIQDNEIRLISQCVLDAQIFGSTNEWETSTLRDWLNSEFLRNAFSPEEQSAMLRDSFKNHVTIPSKDEALDMSTVSAEPTQYARNRGVMPHGGTNASYITQSQAGGTYIWYIGSNARAGWMNPNSICGVRPVIAIDRTKLQDVKGNGMPNNPWRIEKIIQP